MTPWMAPRNGGYAAVPRPDSTPLTAVIAKVLAAHRFEDEALCTCGWEVPQSDDYETECGIWEGHLARAIAHRMIGAQ